MNKNPRTSTANAEIENVRESLDEIAPYARASKNAAWKTRKRPAETDSATARVPYVETYDNSKAVTNAETVVSQIK